MDEELINREYKGVTTRKPMPVEARAGQFAPFAALSGHDEAIGETARLTAGRMELSDDEMQRMSERLNALLAMPRESEVTVTYFRRDERKFGGAYVSHISRLKGVDEAYGRLELSDGLRIDLRDIVALGSPELPEC